MSGPTQREAAAVFAKIGFLSFGGPAAQIALMHRELVEEKGWLAEKQFLSAISFCMLLPGPEAMQLATYAGWRLHGVFGGLVAGLLFVLPGAFIMLALAMLYAFLGDVPLVSAIFLGVKAAVLVIVIEALLRVSRKALKGKLAWRIAAAAFVGIFILNISYPLIVLLSAVIGWFAIREEATLSSVSPPKVPLVATLRTIAIWLAIWWLPVLGLALFSDAPILTEIALFFSKLAVVTFGGAYAVLAYMGQDVVTQFGWLSAGEMMDGLGLAETTPGPLILVTQFVGFLAAFGAGGFWLGLLGALVTLWVTFVPCFLWIFAGAPYIDAISANPRLSGALSAITAAVVGVILNLSVWFSLHVVFGEVTRTVSGPFTLWLPEITTFDWRVLVIALACGVLLLGRHVALIKVLAVAAVSGILLSAI